VLAIIIAQLLGMLAAIKNNGVLSPIALGKAGYPKGRGLKTLPKRSTPRPAAARPFCT
jgi:hypothetical protein